MLPALRCRRRDFFTLEPFFPCAACDGLFRLSCPSFWPFFRRRLRWQIASPRPAVSSRKSPLALVVHDASGHRTRCEAMPQARAGHGRAQPLRGSNSPWKCSCHRPRPSGRAKPLAPPRHFKLVLFPPLRLSFEGSFLCTHLPPTISVEHVQLHTASRGLSSRPQANACLAADSETCARARA